MTLRYVTLPPRLKGKGLKPWGTVVCWSVFFWCVLCLEMHPVELNTKIFLHEDVGISLSVSFFF